MNGSNYLLDTCFILGLCNQNPEVLNTFGDIPITPCYVSVITRIELLGYASIATEDEAFLQSVLSEITSLSLSDDIEEETIRLRKHHKIKLSDAINKSFPMPRQTVRYASLTSPYIFLVYLRGTRGWKLST